MGLVHTVSQTVTFSNGLHRERYIAFFHYMRWKIVFHSASFRKADETVNDTGGGGDGERYKEKLKWQLLPTFVLDGYFGLESAARIWQPPKLQSLRWRTLWFQPRLQVTTANWCFSSLLLGQQRTQSSLSHVGFWPGDEVERRNTPTGIGRLRWEKIHTSLRPVVVLYSECSSLQPPPPPRPSPQLVEDPIHSYITLSDGAFSGLSTWGLNIYLKFVFSSKCRGAPLHLQEDKQGHDHTYPVAPWGFQIQLKFPLKPWKLSNVTGNVGRIW